MSTSDNAYAAARREKKASAIAVVLRDADATCEAAAALDAEGRRTVEHLAQVNPSSNETWVLAVAKLARMRHESPPDEFWDAEQRRAAAVAKADEEDVWGDLDRSHVGHQTPSDGRPR